MRIEPIVGTPSFLSIGRWRRERDTLEIVSRKRLDSRQVVPYFVHDATLHVGLLERERASRSLRGGHLVGLEPIGFDFGGVDETADILNYGNAIFTSRAQVEIDESRLKIPLPSYARSIGYLTELSLPLLLAIRPPPARDIEVTWNGATHRIVFRSIEETVHMLAKRSRTEQSEDLAIFLRALCPDIGAASETPTTGGRSDHDASKLVGRERDAFLERWSSRLWTKAELAERVVRSALDSRFTRDAGARAEDLRFLGLHRIHHQGQWIEVVRPGSGTSLAMMPYVRAGGETYFVLWQETRTAVLERYALQPLYDTPIHPRYINATACFLSDEEARIVRNDGGGEPLRYLTEQLISRAFARPVRIESARMSGPGAEPAPSVSSEVRHRVLAEVGIEALQDLPEDAFLISAGDLSRAIADGFIHDPVIVATLLEIAPSLGLDPFADARTGDPTERKVFVDAMTQGSIIQRRLRGYSSIEMEQLESPTYAKLMTLLQHEFGVRIVYPRNAKERSFFKAAFRVFMADDREENRALQGLHWSHDAFHFALGNFTTVPVDKFEGWYVSGAPAPAEAPPEGPAFDTFRSALKAAEDEATFFSFWTLYREKPSLVRHVGKLTFYEALQDLGITTRGPAREIFAAVTSRAELPELVHTAAAYRQREEVRALFDYMLGFRDYHLKDIRSAWKHASRDPYRAWLVRLGVYEDHAGRYLESVTTFQEKLDRQAPGLNPLLAASADVRIALRLRAWDLVKAMRLVRTAVEPSSFSSRANEDARADMLAESEKLRSSLETTSSDLAALRREITDSEITARNERTFDRLEELAARVEKIRSAIWDRVEGLGVLAADVVARERVREIPN